MTCFVPDESEWKAYSRIPIRENSREFPQTFSRISSHQIHFHEHAQSRDCVQENISPAVTNRKNHACADSICTNLGSRKCAARSRDYAFSENECNKREEGFLNLRKTLNVARNSCRLYSLICTVQYYCVLCIVRPCLMEVLTSNKVRISLCGNQLLARNDYSNPNYSPTLSILLPNSININTYRSPTTIIIVYAFFRDSQHILVIDVILIEKQCLHSIEVDQEFGSSQHYHS